MKLNWLHINYTQKKLQQLIWLSITNRAVNSKWLGTVERAKTFFSQVLKSNLVSAWTVCREKEKKVLYFCCDCKKKWKYQSDINLKMSPRQWWSLLAFYISYLFFGASVFYHNEHSLESERRAVALAERVEINGNYILSNIDTAREYCFLPPACVFNKTLLVPLS